MPQEPSLSLTTVTLTDRERRVILRALSMASAMFDALGDPECATGCLELAYRVMPEGDRE